MGESSPDLIKSFDSYYALIGQGDYIDPIINNNGKTENTNGHITNILTEKTINFINQDHHKPFFTILSYKSVHGPFTPLPENKGKYPKPFLNSLPESYDYSYYCFDCVKEQYSLATLKSLTNKYFETLAGVDQSVDDIYNALEKKGILQNTMIIFTSDNGYLFGEHGLLDKRVAYEESIKVPMIIRYPKLINPNNSSYDGIVLNIDIAPTILDLAQIKAPEDMNGVSMINLINGEEFRDYFFYEYFPDMKTECYPEMQAVRTLDQKLIIYKNSICNIEFYDLKSDPLEISNNINNQQYKDDIESLKLKLKDHFK